MNDKNSNWNVGSMQFSLNLAANDFPAKKQPLGGQCSASEGGVKDAVKK